MSSNPITVTIAGDDAQLNAILAKALANIKTFGTQAGASAEHMSKSFGESRASVALLNEELGTKLSKHLRSIIASSQLLGPLLNAAFPLVAAIGFVDVLEKIPELLKEWFDKMSGIVELDKQIEEHSKLAETFHKIAEEVGKVRSELENVGKTSIEIAQAAAREAQFRLISAQLVAGQQESLAKSISQSAKAASGFAFDVPGATGPRRTGENTTDEDRAMSSALSTHAAEARANISLLQAQFEKAVAELNKALDASADKFAKSAAEAAKRFDELMFKVRQDRTKVSPSISTTGNHIGTFTDLLAMQDEPNQEIAAKYLKHFQALQAVFAETRRPAELLAISIQNLNDLFRGDTTSEVYKRALENIKDRYDEARQAAERFGQEVGHALAEGILMGRSWKNVLDSLIIAFAQLIVKMYLLKALQDSSFGSSKIGGFFTSLVSGFGGGKAGGGPVSGGMPYLVGEKGPEIFMPNTSGSIVPNGRFGGGGNVFNIDARWAEIGVEQKIVAAMNYAIKTSVAQSVGIVRENSLRGRG